MSGILAIICKNPNEKINLEQLKLMTDSLYHRGPDDEGYAMFHSGNVYDLNNLKIETNSILKTYYESDAVGNNNSIGSLAFGFRRLSILDLSPLGHQPMSYLNRYWIVFNGEIYNYIEIREELRARGYQFKSNTDTEVILAAYDYWGTGCFNKFNGMWALIIYDIQQNKIIISRDRFGLKPLYYFEDQNKIIFASEIKAIHKANLDSKKIDLEKTKLFLVYGDNSWSSETILKNVQRFPANTYFTISSINPIIDIENMNNYWTLKLNKDPYYFNKSELDRNLNVYRNLLKSSIELRRRSAVKVGATLSGGLDSSSVVYFMLNNDESRAYLPDTFSSVYEDIRFKEFHESPYINCVADFLKVNNHKITPINELVFDDFSEMIYFSDLPTNFSNISGWNTYKLIKQSGTKITLDGLGADGMFAGSNSDYKNYFKGLKIKSFMYELIKTKKNFPEFNPTKMILLRTLVSFPENSWWNPFKFYFKSRKHLYLSLNESLAFFFNHELFNGLHYIDSMSMAHSIESRQPFLDYRLVEFAFAINQSYKISQGWTKYICRLAMSGLLPDEVVWRKDEMGWPNLDSLWFDDIHKNKVTNLLEQSKLLSSLISSEEKRVLIDGKINTNKMRALSLSIWEERFF